MANKGKKLAAGPISADDRLRQVEMLLYEVHAKIAAAQCLMSVLVNIPKAWPKVDKLRTDAKAAMYAVEAARAGGLCVLDETAATAARKAGSR